MITIPGNVCTVPNGWCVYVEKQKVQKPPSIGTAVTSTPCLRLCAFCALLIQRDCLTVFLREKRVQTFDGEAGRVCAVETRLPCVCVRARRILPVCTFCLGCDSASFYHPGSSFLFFFCLFSSSFINLSLLYG